MKGGATAPLSWAISEDLQQGVTGEMEERDSLIHGILNYGPSADSVCIILEEMKKEGRSSEVLRECARFLRAYPHHTGLRLMLAESLREVGFVGLAERELEKVTGMVEDLISSYKMLGELYARQDRGEEASRMLGIYLAHNPDDVEALRLLDAIGQSSGGEETSPGEEQPVQEETEAADEPEEGGGGSGSLTTT